jgi:pimeloyl-ACP methyl ester carboxylesterase
MTLIATEEHFLNAGKGRIYAKRWRVDHDGNTDRAPVVLLHDSLGSVELWRDFPERLAIATGRDVIAYDRLGFGRSDPNPETLPPLRFIHDEADGSFRCLHEVLNLGRFILFGHSVGGGMAAGCAARYPDLCEALITESAQMFAEDRTLQGIRDAKLAFAVPDQMARLARYHGEKTAWVLGAWIDSWLAPEFAAWNAEDDLRGIRCPMLVIHGDNDEYGSVRHPQYISEIVGERVTVSILENCGHVPHREQMPQVLERVGGWLEAVVQNGVRLKGEA